MSRFTTAVCVAALATTRLVHGQIAFLAAPRTDGFFKTQSVAEAGFGANNPLKDGPHTNQPNAQLITRVDGVEKVLVQAGAWDFSVCADGRTLLASIIKKDRADIYRIDSVTGETVQLTDGPGWNCQPVECGDGSIAFLSDRDNWRNPGENYKAFTIYRMAADGREVERIWHAGFGGVFGLFCGPDGRLYFSTGENQGGLRGGAGENWAIWSVNPDGGDFEPEFSAYGQPGIYEMPLDWPAIMPDGSLIVSQYYDTRVYGTLLRCPEFIETPGGPTKFAHPLWGQNSRFDTMGGRFGWQRRGIHSIAVWADADDSEGFFHFDGVGEYVGHVSHPAAVPGGGLICTWTGPRDTQMNLGIYKLPDDGVSNHPSDMTPLIDRADRHEWFGKALVPYSRIYGIKRPATPVTRKASRSLPAASPFGVLGTSSIDWNEWVFHEPKKSKMRVMAEDEAEYIRVLAFQPSKAVFGSIGPGGIFIENNRYPGRYGGDNSEGFATPTNERTGFYDKLIPLKKWRTPGGDLYLGPNPPQGSQRITRIDGRPDSSFCVELPANQCWTLQLLNAKREAIVTANTWHQVIPAESRTDCRGCHAHAMPDPVPFEATFAASQEYPRVRLENIRTIEFERDVKKQIPGVSRTPWRPTAARAFESWTQTYDDNPAWTEDQRRLYRTWQDTGFLATGNYWKKDWTTVDLNRLVEAPLGAYDDTMQPTLAIRKYSYCTVIGAFDPNSGIASLKVTADGKDVTKRFRFNAEHHIWVGPSYQRGVVEATATDGRGNVTKLERRAVESRANPFPVDRTPYSSSWN